MKAIGYKRSLPVTEADALLDIELPKPTAVGHDLLIRVEAISVNPVDTKVRRGGDAPAGDYKVLGWDAAGVVEAVGEQVTLFKPGDKVWYAGAIDRPGTNAEYHLVDERIVAHMPTSLDFAGAAALPLTAITAWELLFDRLKITPETAGTMLVIGGAGGVGSILIQLAKRLTKLTVIATASRPETSEWATSLGADQVINHRHSLMAELQALGVQHVDYVACLTHTEEHLPEIARVLKPQGALGIIAGAPSLDIMPFMQKSISIHWELMFTRPLFKTDDMIKQHELLTEIAAMVDRGEIKTTIHDHFGSINAQNLLKAHALLESGKAKGKIVLVGF